MATVTKQLARLTNKQRRYLKLRGKHATKREAALAAGYSESTATRGMHNIEKGEDFQAVFRNMIRNAVRPKKIAQVIAKGLNAKNTEFAKFEGKITDKTDTIAWSERRAYAELAAEYAGYYVKSSNAGTTAFNIATAYIGPVGDVQPLAEVQSPNVQESKAIDVESTATSQPK